MIELYLFIHPLDVNNIELLDSTLKSLNEQDSKSKFHLVPVADFQMINHYLSTYPIFRKTVNNRNQMLDTAYQMALDYEVLLTFDASLALKYYKDMMELLTQQPYSSKLRDQYLMTLGCPVDRFLRRRQFPIYKEKLIRNQHLMRQMKVSSIPSFVIYNFEQDEDVAILLDNIYDFKMLPQLLEADSFSSPTLSMYSIS